MKQNLYPLIPLLALLALCQTACITHKEIVNFAPIQVDATEKMVNLSENPVQPGDILHITVHSFDLEAVRPFNLTPVEQQNPNMMMATGLGSELLMGYLVDKNGQIDFPVVGTVTVAGLTLTQTKVKMLELLRKYIKDAVVNVRFLNFRVTVLGEVYNPGTLQLASPRITLLEAIGRSGDMTPYANRTNLLLIRERDGLRSFVRLNLQSTEVFSSPYFYLQQNDVVYVEPLRARAATTVDPATRVLPYISGGLSLITLVIALLR
jgi:polysaccharide biosynthesis/export protein